MAQRTLWEEGRQPGPVVVGGVASALLVAVLLTEIFGSQLGFFFDLVFVLACLGAALMVRPRDFFTVGVLPPLALIGTILLVAVVDRTLVADVDDHLAQATVSGLAHHAQALAVGYALALATLALRQVAMRNQGRLRVPRPDRCRRGRRRRTRGHIGPAGLLTTATFGALGITRSVAFAPTGRPARGGLIPSCGDRLQSSGRPRSAN